MRAERLEFTAIVLIIGMAAGVLLGGQAFPQMTLALGDTLGGSILGAGGAMLAGIGYEVLVSLGRHH